MKITSLSPSTFLLVLLAFALPFVEVSCQGDRATQLTGYELAMGKKVKIPGTDWFGSSPKYQQQGGLWSAVLVLGCAVLGLGVFFLPPALQPKCGTILSAIGLLGIFILTYHVNQEVLEKGEGLFDYTYLMGFWFTLLGFIGALGWHLARLKGVRF